MLKSLAIAAALIPLAGAASAADVSGLWKTPVHNGEVEISHCGPALCGRLVTSDRMRENPGMTDAKNQDAGLRSRPLKGLPMLSGFTGGPSVFDGGKVYNPDDGKTYSGTITVVDDNTLKLRGCVFVPLCKTQVWTRVP